MWTNWTLYAHAKRLELSPQLVESEVKSGHTSNSPESRLVLISSSLSKSIFRHAVEVDITPFAPRDEIITIYVGDEFLRRYGSLHQQFPESPQSQQGSTHGLGDSKSTEHNDVSSRQADSAPMRSPALAVTAGNITAVEKSGQNNLDRDTDAEHDRETELAHPETDDTSPYLDALPPANSSKKKDKTGVDPNIARNADGREPILHEPPVGPDAKIPVYEGYIIKESAS